MASLVDACIFIAASAGTGSFVVSSPVPGWRTPASAGATNGATYRYRAYSADQSEWEVGTGVYTSGTTTLTRAVILASSNAGSAVNFAIAPSVALTIFSADIATEAQLAKVDYLTVTASTDLDTIRTKAGYLTVTGATDLDTIRTKAGYLTVTGATDLDTIRTKAGHISVTQAVDLDSIESLAGTALQPAAIGVSVQAYDTDLTTWAGLTPSANAQSLVTAADYAAMKTLLSLNNVDNTSNATERAATATLTNKRITPRVTTITSSGTPTVNTDNCDIVNITALAAAITSMTTNLTGTPSIGDVLVFQIKDDGTARAITWGASFTAKGVALPTTTVINKLLTAGFIWNGSNWGCVGVAQET